MISLKFLLKVVTFLMFMNLSTFANDVFFQGQYDVPVERELSEFAKFPLDQIEFREDRFKYRLPTNLAEMPGEEIVFKKIGVDGDITQYESEFGVAECRFLNDPITRCDIDYNQQLSNILIEGKEEVRQRLIDQGIAGEELIRRMMVIDGFSGDPIGILYIHRPSTTGPSY